MGFFSSLFHGIVGAATGFFTGGPVGAVIGGIGGLASAGSSAGNSAADGIVNGISSLIGGGGGSVGSAIENILGGISGTINDVSKEVATIIDPIKKVLDSVTGLAQQFNDQLVQPIAKIVTESEQTGKALVTALHNDLGHGLAGLAKLPTDITNALTSVDAQFARSQAELAGQQKSIASDIFKPALVDGIGAPLKGIHGVMTESPFTEDDNAAFQARDPLNEVNTSPEATKWIEYLEHQAVNPKGIFAPLIRFMFSVLKAGDFMVAQGAAVTKQLEQQANTTVLPELLGVGEVIEGLRRGLISADDAGQELAKQGYDPSRQKVLYDLAQFLFSPAQAVDLLQRGIIAQDDFNVLMDQNNLDADQAADLIKLMMHILGPGDIAAARARGYIDDKAMADLFNAARVPDTLWTTIRELELALKDPKLMTAMYGRGQASQTGILGAALGGEAPPELKAQFDRTQSEAGTADLAWLAHWKVPGPEWWVDAWFRGLVTLSDVENAFVANNLPPELWDLVFKVEEELPPVWLIPDIIASGVWTKEQAIPQFKKLGFSDANAEVLYNYGYSKSKTAKAQTAADLQKVSLSNAAAMFNDGLIDQGEYLQILLDHGYSQDAAQLTVNLDVFKQTLAQRKEVAQSLIDEANMGLITTEQVQSQLYALGFTQTEVITWLNKLHKSKVAKTKVPSRAELDAMLKKSLIDQTEYMATMEVLGYSAYWSERFMELAIGP